jgi:hypothetical protein
MPISHLLCPAINCHRGSGLDTYSKPVAKMADEQRGFRMRQIAENGKIPLMKRLRRPLRTLIRTVAIIGGLWGGWLAAGSLNDRRIDVPRRVIPATQPAPSPALR